MGGYVARIRVGNGRERDDVFSMYLQDRTSAAC